MGAHQSVYERVTNTIIAELEQGTASWVKPWAGGASIAVPHNAVSHRRYSGINVLLLWDAAMNAQYRNPAWLTFRQAKGLGGHVRKGEHATVIVYASSMTKSEEDKETGEEHTRRIPFLRTYLVFNVEQTEGLPEHLYRVGEPKPIEQAIEHVEAFLRQVGADVRHGGNSACYLPSGDFIALPEPGYFESPSHYYATSLHEHGHWTGHETRLARDLKGRFGTEAYAAEELIAELTAAYLCASLSIPGRLRHSEYIGSWLKLLGHDKRAVFTAATKATEAATFLERVGGIHVEPATTEEEI